MDYPKRKLPRLRGYDYATPGFYFVTICTFKKQCIFGKILAGDQIGDATMVYSPVGEIAKSCLLEIESHFEGIKVDNWVIMPNHIHILFQIKERTERIYPFPATDIPKVVGTFKAAVTRAVGKAYMPSGTIWQSSYYDHIIRDDEDYRIKWQYITGNPSRWLEDDLYIE